MAELLRFRLRRIGVDVRLLAGAGNELLEGLAAAGPGDLVVVFSFSKRSTEGAILLDWQREAGYRTLLFTGQLSPLPDPQPDIRLFVYRGEANEYHSMAAPAAIVDALVLGVSAKLGDRAVDRLARLRALKQRYTNP